MDFVCFEDCAHVVIAPNHTLVVRILEVAFMDVFPNAFHGLGAGELG